MTTFTTATTAATAAQAPKKGDGMLWADKYKPRTISEMCYPVCANKLKAWMETFTPAGQGDPKKTRAVLLSGPPGIGKTTTVYTVAMETGRTVVEYNASDFRSRKSLRENVSTLTENRAFASDANSYTKVVLLMDEVDGCDIGGVGEVIEMIKGTVVPIVCTCNDRWHPKLRSLMNYVEDLRFSRPPCNIVANYLYDKVLAREGVTLSKALLQDVVKRSGSDIRNMLNNLQVWCINTANLEQRKLAQCAVQSEKNGDAGLFEAAEYFLLQGTSHGERHSIKDMEACYYNNDLIDMFVQENYLHFSPPNADHLSCVADAATCISRADAAQRMMYLEQNWSVSRAYALFSSIAPCVLTRGKYISFLDGQQQFFDRQRPVKFPSWLGNNSTTSKNKRLLRCMTAQAQRSISGHQEDVVLDYTPLGWECPLTQPLAESGKDGIHEVIAFMDTYGLQRDDWDLVQSASHFKKMKSRSMLPTPEIPTAVKSAFTREFNRTHRMDSFSKAILKNVGKGEDTVGSAANNGDGDGDGDEANNESAKDSVAAMVVAAKPRGKKAVPKKEKTAPARRAAKKAPPAAASGGRRKNGAVPAGNSSPKKPTPKGKSKKRARSEDDEDESVSSRSRSESIVVEDSSSSSDSDSSSDSSSD